MQLSNGAYLIMPKFFYIARDKTGKKITGDEDCADKDELIGRLQAKGLVVIHLGLKSKGPKAKPEKLQPKLKVKYMHRRVTLHDLTMFCRQLATLLGAGVTVIEALSIIQRQVTSRQFYKVIDDLKKNMELGLSLHEAMAKSRSVFSDLWVNLVESGEASGNLAVVLSRLASYLERNARFRGKIVSALIYPGILMTVGMGALLFLTTKIIPTFATLFAGFNIQLPLITRMLIQVSGFIRKYLLLILIAIVIVMFLIRKYIKLPSGRRQYENFQFNLPVFGEFFRNLVVERFTSGMSTLIESGVPILYALEISERSVNNLIASDIIHDIKDEVSRGRPLSAPMEKSGFFAPMVVQMVSIGEEVGELSEMFKKINSFYQEYVETFLGRFTSMFEPIMLVFMGVIIGIMIVGMFLPIFQITQIGTGG